MDILERNGHAFNNIIYRVGIPLNIGHAVHGDLGILRGLGVNEVFSGALRLVDQPGEVCCIRVVSIVVRYR